MATKIPTPAKQKSGKSQKLSVNLQLHHILRPLPPISPVLSFEDRGSCEDAATALRPPSGRRGMYCRRFCSYAICFTNISCIFAPKELKRGLEGGISLSTKSRHLPLRKQFHHDSSGKSYKQSLLRLLCFYGCTSIAVIQYCTFESSHAFCPTINLTNPIPGQLCSIISMRLNPF